MKRSLFSLLTVLLLLLPLAGCGGGAEEVVAAPGQEFSLSIGQSASIQGEDLKLKFLEVVNDSRCPKDVVCVWQGQASCLVEITYRESLHRLTLTPYPEAGKEIRSEDYRLLLVVTKPPVLSGGILVTFDVLGETYRVFITNKDTIADIFALKCGLSEAAIPSGRIVKGAVSYNAPWSWHIDSEDIHMAGSTIELCDGKPSDVEADLDYWADNVKRFCPWQAEVVGIEDYR